MTRRTATVLCLSLASAGVYGYIPSKHPTTKKVDIDKLVSEITVESADVPKTEAAAPAPLRLEPIFDSNPLEKVAFDVATKQAPVPAVVSESRKEETALSRRERKQSLFVMGSSALASFTDVFTLAKFGCFANMCTGNLLKATSGLTGGRMGEAALNGLFVVSYLMGVALFNGIKRRYADDDDALSLIAPIVISLFVGADIAARSWGGSIKALQVPCLTCGFGLVNSAAGHATGGTIFFAMTGHLSKITNWISDSIASRTLKLDAATGKSLRVVSSFVGGALAAALVQKHLSRFSIPVCTTLGLLYATLFGWYAPLTPALKRRLESTRIGQRITRFGRLLKPAFSRGLQPEPIVVDVFPVEDLLQASNATGISYGY